MLSVLVTHTWKDCPIPRWRPFVTRSTLQQRALLEYHLRHEHTLLRQSSSTEAISEIIHGRGVSSRTDGPAHLCSSQELNAEAVRHRNTSGDGGAILIPPNAKVVGDLFRKSRLRRCFKHILRQQQWRRESREQSSATTPQPALVLQRQGIEHLGALDEETKKEVESAIPPAPAQPPQPAELHYEAVAGINVVEPRLPERPVPAEDSPRPRDESDDEAERARRRVLLRRFFQAARRRDIVDEGDWLDLGESRAPAAVGGAPCFTVGGSRRRSTTSATRRGHEGNDEEIDYANSFGDPGGLRLRRADLLRRILRAMRYAYIKSLRLRHVW